jgi:hypothetical protein
MVKEIISRKEFLQRCVLTGLAVVGGGSLVSACGGGEEKGESGGTSHETATQTTGSDDPCVDYSELSETDLQMRKSLKYAEKSTETSKNCENCKFYTAPEAGSQCGGCTLFKGPVHPGGYCSSWFAANQG